jgi:uncharacterized cupredoxin-like copper-binding protein
MYLRAGELGLIRLTAVAMLAVAMFAISSCSSGGKASHTGGRVLRIAERDFKIVLPQKRVRAGDISLLVHNKGPASHELIVIRKGRSRLPLRRDGMTVDEDALEHSIPGALEPEIPGTHRLKVHLTPGRYELICNMSGHFFGGMRTQLVVQ